MDTDDSVVQDEQQSSADTRFIAVLDIKSMNFNQLKEVFSTINNESIEQPINWEKPDYSAKYHDLEVRRNKRNERQQRRTQRLNLSFLFNKIQLSNLKTIDTLLSRIDEIWNNTERNGDVDGFLDYVNPYQRKTDHLKVVIKQFNDNANIRKGMTPQQKNVHDSKKRHLSSNLKRLEVVNDCWNLWRKTSVMMTQITNENGSELMKKIKFDGKIIVIKEKGLQMMENASREELVKVYAELINELDLGKKFKQKHPIVAKDIDRSKDYLVISSSNHSWKLVHIDSLKFNEIKEVLSECNIHSLNNRINSIVESTNIKGEKQTSGEQVAKCEMKKSYSCFIKENILINWESIENRLKQMTSESEIKKILSTMMKDLGIPEKCLDAFNIQYQDQFLQSFQEKLAQEQDENSEKLENPYHDNLLKCEQTRMMLKNQNEEENSEEKSKKYKRNMASRDVKHARINFQCWNIWQQIEKMMKRIGIVEKCWEELKEKIRLDASKKDKFDNVMKNLKKEVPFNWDLAEMENNIQQQELLFQEYNMDLVGNSGNEMLRAKLNDIRKKTKKRKIVFRKITVLLIEEAPQEPNLSVSSAPKTSLKRRNPIDHSIHNLLWEPKAKVAKIEEPQLNIGQLLKFQLQVTRSLGLLNNPFSYNPWTSGFPFAMNQANSVWSYQPTGHIYTSQTENNQQEPDGSQEENKNPSSH